MNFAYLILIKSVLYKAPEILVFYLSKYKNITNFMNSKIEEDI